VRTAFNEFLAWAMSRLEADGLSPSMSLPARAWPIPTSLKLPAESYKALLVVGDAAGLAHPLSGEGIGPALISGEAAANAAVEYHRHRSVRRLHSDYLAALRATALRTSPTARRLAAAAWRLTSVGK
jgi:flavin-dependent dehydrogenase